jgi:hypothetical protein
VLYRWTLSCKSVEVSHLQHKKAQEEADAAAAEKVNDFLKRIEIQSCILETLEKGKWCQRRRSASFGDLSDHTAQ